MNEINVKFMRESSILLNAYESKEYADIRELSRCKLKDYEYMFKKAYELVHPINSNQLADMLLVDCPRIVFPDNVVEAARILMAISMIKSIKEQGLISEDEFKAMEKVGEERWRRALYGDMMLTKRAVLKEEC